MKISGFIYLFFVFLLLLCHAEEIYEERDYLIFVKCPDINCEINDIKIKKFSKTYEDKIDALIQRYKNSYSDRSKIDEIENNFKLDKNNENVKYATIKPTTCINGNLILYAPLLSPKIIEKIKSLPNVISVGNFI